MKEYKYKINGNLYNVVIGDIEDNIAHVEVNGTHYTVEMEKKPKAAPAPKPVARPVAKPAAAPAAKAEEKLGWVREISFTDLVKRMVNNDLAIVKAENNL